ncbi:septum formation protein Maf [Eggerthellaceae bacterium zg-1084]|uniref:Maf family protein n=1 Tax=Berryella wangjianweii TaxID=2734634 RepID=UPI00155539D6|nr:Maf family nucleotide pyrophosphatase [Berryella wangjianweii]NPD31523.1 septum formation protein Maf [Berryella wangjianweii]NPD32982.1 septum formation protein Maf [Eggerthellaceae bacterium zg-997]
MGEQAVAVDQQDDIEFQVVLASASPRRAHLLRQAGVPFVVHATEVDESLEPDDLVSLPEAAKKLAERKARAAVQELVVETFAGSLIVIGADTVVDCDGRLFGKPADVDHARRMLRALAGRTHRVHTAVSVWLIHAPSTDDLSLGYRTFVDTARVTFRPLTDADIDAYLSCGESLDKAGAYAIQGAGGGLVEGVEGLRSTVVGLPIERLMGEFPDIARQRQASAVGAPGAQRAEGGERG